MANPFSASVNDALYKAKLQLQLFQALELHQAEKHEQNAKTRTLMLSHREAVCYHLVCAYRLFLQELAHAQNLPPGRLQSAADLLEQGESAEAMRLLQLERTAGSFLEKTLLAEQSAWAAVPAGSHTAPQSSGLITTANISDEGSELSELVDAMKQLVGECRETLVEW